ncbi:MAG: hypothetical protein SXV54_19780 [Chloroflexota bacterium]|nr:hypothetical protein [Chloroflexota bacterium]
MRYLELLVLRERAFVGQDANKLALPYCWKHLGTVRPQNIEMIPPLTY